MGGSWTIPDRNARQAGQVPVQLTGADVEIEAVWGADPLEHIGGFHNLEYDANASFRSSLAVNGSIQWSSIAAKTTYIQQGEAGVTLLVDFPDIEWESLRSVYGWAAYQWQAWIRGEIIVQPGRTRILSLQTPQVLEFWVDDVHYFGGDFYSYGRAPLTLRLAPGVHRIEVRLVRDVRAMGGVGEPSMQISFSLAGTWSGLHPVLRPQTGVLISDVLDSTLGSVLASPWASVVLRNDDDEDLYVYAIEATHNACLAELVSPSEIRLVPGQSRPVTFRVSCVRSDWRIKLVFNYRRGDASGLSLTVLANPVHRRQFEPHKVTYLHPGGIVSYAILRPPSQKAIDEAGHNASLPVLLGLHGAGVEAEWDSHRLTFEPLPDLHAWVLLATGVTSWSGDDWHAWGFPDVEAAIAMIPDWIKQNEWMGPGVDVDRWFVAGHSNGGQGTWYTLLHRPDKVIAAAVLSGYSSIQNYVPYTFWQPADPGRTAVVQSALGSYRHEMLLSNAKGIPVFQQHGGADDNVPPYHGRLQSQLIHEAGANSTFMELEGKPHFWDGAYTTEALQAFYQKHLESNNGGYDALELQDFTITVANPGDTGPKNGVHIVQLTTPGQLGHLDVLFDSLARGCILRTKNIRTFHLPAYFQSCSFVNLDARNISLPGSQQTSNWSLTKTGSTWHIDDSTSESIPAVPSRLGRQLGQMDSILRTQGTFQIVEHSSKTRHVALQISRNLCQYFAADTLITSSHQTAFESSGNVIIVAIGDSLPDGYHKDFPITIQHNEVRLRNSFGEDEVYTDIAGLGLAAIFLRPLPLGRLELVVWGSDEASLAIAARLVPMMPGSGQPDFVVADRRMLAVGLEGVLAMGFFDEKWEVSRNSFLS